MLWPPFRRSRYPASLPLPLQVSLRADLFANPLPSPRTYCARGARCYETLRARPTVVARHLHSPRRHSTWTIRCASSMCTQEKHTDVYTDSCVLPVRRYSFKLAASAVTVPGGHWPAERVSEALGHRRHHTYSMFSQTMSSFAYGGAAIRYACAACPWPHQSSSGIHVCRGRIQMSCVAALCVHG